MTKALSRRDFLRLAGLVAASSAAAGCAPVYARLGGGLELDVPEPEALWKPVVFAGLNRLTFGPRLEERQRAAETGLAGWIEEQLAPESIDDGEVAWRLRQFATLSMTAADLADLSDRLFDEQDRSTVPAELRQATLVRQVYSRGQLYELMVEFWSDHFNISVDKGDCWFLKTVDDREVIRPHAMGRFRDLLWASAHSPAMLVYLDNQVNQKGAPNENYAREVMELHTLGVSGGYSQADVMELARALTGWTVRQHFWRGKFQFDPEAHDPGTKSVLGLTLGPEGQREAERVLEMLATHPATAQHIAARLARRFLADEPPAQIVARAAAAFIQTEGDIRAVLRVILLDGLLAQTGVSARFKRPVHFVASALRQLGARTDGGPVLHDYLARMGQAYFAWPTPDGYPDRTEAWRGNLLPRWQLALAVARNEVAGTQIDPGAFAQGGGGRAPSEMADWLSLLLLGAPMPAGARDDLLAALDRAGTMPESELPAVLVAGLLASPAFQWR